MNIIKSLCEWIGGTKESEDKPVELIDGRYYDENAAKKLIKKYKVISCKVKLLGSWYWLDGEIALGNGECIEVLGVTLKDLVPFINANRYKAEMNTLSWHWTRGGKQ
jgi:hypothetical protein